MRHFLKSATIALGFAAVAFATASAQTIEKKDITIGLSVTTSTYLPLYVAEKAGYFKEEGVNVRILPFKGGTDLVRGMVAGAVDIGVGALSEALVGVDTGQGIKVFYSGFNMAVFDWYSVPSIKTLADAKGARFGVTTFGSSTDYLTRYALGLHGIDPKKDVRIIQGGASAPRFAAMAAGQLDVNIFGPPEKFLAAEKGYRKIMSQKEIAEDYPFHVFYAREDFIENDPNAIKAVLRGFIKGLRRAKADKQFAVDVLVEKVALDKKDAPSTYDDLIGQIYEDGRLPSEAGMKAFWDIGIMGGIYKEAWPKEKYWVGTFHNTYDQWKPN